MTDTPHNHPVPSTAAGPTPTSAGGFSVAYGWWLLLCGLCVLGVVRLLWQQIEPPPAASVAPVYQVDINSATPAEFEVLPEVGETLARRIVEHRQTHGAFANCEALLEVHGMGSRTLEQLRPMLTVRQPPIDRIAGNSSAAELSD